MKLYSYYRSSSAYRVRIALNLKALEYETVPVNLVDNAQQEHGYSELNPQCLIPALITDDELVLTQSLAICEYLEEAYPDKHPLLPEGTYDRARVRLLANIICCDIHPLNNLRVLNYLEDKLEISKEQKLDWYQQWIETGFSALESALAKSKSTGCYCYGNKVTLVDTTLIPQLYNARRFECSLEAYPNLKFL